MNPTRSQRVISISNSKIPISIIGNEWFTPSSLAMAATYNFSIMHNFLVYYLNYAF